MSPVLMLRLEINVAAAGTVSDFTRPCTRVKPRASKRTLRRRQFLSLGESTHRPYYRSPVFCLLFTGAGRQPPVPVSLPPRAALLATRRRALRPGPGFLQMIEQRHDAGGRRFRHGIGDVAPAPVQAAGGDGVLLLDLADLAALGVEQRPAHRHLLLALG